MVSCLIRLGLIFRQPEISVWPQRILGDNGSLNISCYHLGPVYTIPFSFHIGLVSYEGQITPRNSVRDSKIPGISQTFSKIPGILPNFAKDS